MDLKEIAEASINKAKEVILKKIPNEEIISIYVKGSYVQDALREDSDVDIVVILKTEEYLTKVYTLSEDKSNTDIIPFQIVAYTLGELQTGERASNRTKVTSPVSTFVKQMDNLPIIFGSKPEGKLFTRTDKKDLTGLLTAFSNTFLPDYRNNKFTFNEIIKQVPWLTEREQRALGVIPDYSWQKLADSIEDKNHIVHAALKYRKQVEISNEEKEAFMIQLDEYLKYLEAKYR